ncbi:MAG TPA: hypothetical protein PKY63_11890, partial [Bacteroidales bacterium]|nr:hypothetical protein [Bacteroidales bacterium]
YLFWNLEPEGKQKTKLQLSRRDKILVARKRTPARAVRYGMVYSMRHPESSENDCPDISIVSVSFQLSKSCAYLFWNLEPEGKQKTKLQLPRRDKILVEQKKTPARAVRYGMVYSMRHPESSKIYEPMACICRIL